MLYITKSESLGKKTGNYMRVGTDFILNDNLGQFGCQLSSI